MANKKLTGNRTRGSLFFILPFLFSVLSLSLFSQKISKYYVAGMQEKGILYYIYKQPSFRSTTGKRYLKFDITYLNSKDSATITFSYFDRSATTLDSLVLLDGSSRVPSQLKKIYIEDEGRSWNYRYSALVPYNNLVSFFSKPGSQTLLLYTKETQVNLKMKNKAWKKSSARLSKIFQLINYNKKS